MSLDAYSYCPGGRDKKIRFCCPDMVKELQQIEKMMQDGQNAACLAYIEQLEPQHPNCACLTAAKLTMLRAQELWDEALALAETFYAREPENALAASELAMSYAFKDRWEDAISTIIDGIERWEESSIHVSLLTGLLVVGEKALADGNVIPALSIARQLQVFAATAEQGQSLYIRSLRTELPLVAKDMVFRPDCPESFPELEQFQKASNYIISARWKKGLAILESLVPHADLWPDLWKNVALLRLCLGNIGGAAEALDSYAKCEKCTLEDAADMELLRMCMISDPLGDAADILMVQCELSDAEKAQEILLSDKRFDVVDFDPTSFIQAETPPPRSVFTILDRPYPKADETLTSEKIATQLGSCILFGKETDREARLELVEIRSFDLENVKNTLHEIIGPQLTNWQEPVLVRSFSETFLRLQPRVVFDVQGEGPTQETQEKAIELFKENFISHWSNMPLGLLGGKTPKEAASDPSLRVRVLGAILLIDFWLTGTTIRDLCNSLRESLGLPSLGVISVPEELSREKLPPLSEKDLLEGPMRHSFLDDVPIWRWYRIELASLPVEALLHGLQESLIFDDARTMFLFCEEILKRPTSEVPYLFRREAIRHMVYRSQLELNTEAGLEWIKRGKIEAEEVGQSDAWLNILEIPLWLARGEGAKAQEIISHLVSSHRNEPEAMQQLQQLFVSLGLLNPDGTQARRPGPAPAPQSPMGTPTPPPEANEPPPSKLWVPD